MASLPSCASTPSGVPARTATRAGSVARAPDASTAEKLEGMRAETELGRNMAGRILALSRPVGDFALSAYVNEVGALVARSSDFPERLFRFEVVDDPGVNAFACPGGYVFVTAGALRLAESEAELAAILGHEIAHVGRGHVLTALRGKDLSDPGGKAPGIAEVEARRRPEPPRSELGSFLSQNLLGPRAAGISLARTVDASLGILLSKGLEPALEYEADALGARYAIRAGYDPASMGRFFARARTRRTDVGGRDSSVEKTHPRFLDREKALAASLGGKEGPPPPGAFGKDRFTRMKASLGPRKETAK